MTDSPQGPYDREQPSTPYGYPGYGSPQPPYGQQPPPYGMMQPYGYGYGPPGGYQPTKTNTLAIVSLVTSLVWMCGAGSVAAIICGHLGIREIKRSGGTQTGRGLAIAGLIIGYLGLLAALFYLTAVVIAIAQDPSSEPFGGY